MHPLVVHFPIALLLFAAVFVVLAIIVPKRGWWFSVSALILLIGGTAGAFVSVSTGEAAMNVAEGDGENEDEMWDIMDQHADKMEQARNSFVVLTVIYAGIVVLPLLVKSLQSWKFVVPTNLIFLAALMWANAALANGAHLGGRLVHEFGVRAALAPEGEAAASEDEEEATEAETESDEPAADADADADAEAPAAEAAEEAGVMEEETAPAAEKEVPAEEPKTEVPAEEPKAEVPAAEAGKEAPAGEPKEETPADAAEEAKEP
jgi:uncharacterized membrane protein